MPTIRQIQWIALLLCGAQCNFAAIIGTNSAALPLSQERINSLPKAERAPWFDYLARSEKQSRADRTFLWNETQRAKTNALIAPPAARGTAGIALDKAPDWYRSDAAIKIADIIVSFQTPAGGWSKNLDMTQHRRAPGELFAQGNLNKFARPGDLDQAHDPNWNYVGTYDNGATITQLRYLAKVASALGREKAAPYRKSFSRGLQYVFAAQYPNGGWPQVWPLQGGYHDGVTYNDGAMMSILELLADVEEGKPDFIFVSKAERKHAAERLRRGLACVLATQVGSNVTRTVWCQQYDELTLQPTSARNYEMPALSSGESAGVLLFLMRRPNPDSNTVAAVRAAAAWFQKVAIRDKAYRRTDDGRNLVDAPGTGPLWSRYYNLSDHQPIFGDRDKTIHDTVSEISRERRDGYAWFTDAPESALKQFKRWNAKHD
jgi:PelA/Pel-15E family pectate lyase